MILTFTTIPPRFPHLGQALDAIARQRLRPDAVELYIPRQYRRFPGPRPSLPPLPDWVQVIETDTDHGPATKVLPALDRWAGKDVDILFCDDDVCHDSEWTARFAFHRTAHRQDVLCEFGLDIEALARDPALARPGRPGPRAVVLWPTAAETAAMLRARAGGGRTRPYLTAPGLVDVFMGFRGVMLRPRWIDRRAWAIPGPLWAVDDVWLSAMAALAGRRIWADGNAGWMTGQSAAAQIDDLYSARIDGLDRAAANRACIDHIRTMFGLWR